jgi:hypothetical protein
VAHLGGAVRPLSVLRERCLSPPPARPQYMPYPVQVPTPMSTSATPVAEPVHVPSNTCCTAASNPPRPAVEHIFEEYVPMSNAGTYVSLSEHEEQSTCIIVAVPEVIVRFILGRAAPVDQVDVQAQPHNTDCDNL